MRIRESKKCVNRFRPTFFLLIIVKLRCLTAFTAESVYARSNFFLKGKGEIWISESLVGRLANRFQTTFLFFFSLSNEGNSEWFNPVSPTRATELTKLFDFGHVSQSMRARNSGNFAPNRIRIIFIGSRPRSPRNAYTRSRGKLMNNFSERVKERCSFPNFVLPCINKIPSIDEDSNQLNNRKI